MGDFRKSSSDCPYGPETDLSALHDIWVPPVYDEQSGKVETYGHYNSEDIGKSFDILVDGHRFEAQTNSVFLDDAPVAHERIFTEVAPHLDQPHDCGVLWFPGFGETDHQAHGTALVALLKSLMVNGYKNPSVLGLNLLGRGTETYAESGSMLSSVRLEDQLSDSAAMMRALTESGKLDCENIVLMGHSMGFLDVLAAYEELDRCQGIDGVRQEIFDKVKTVVGVMPAFGERAACLQLPQFWKVGLSLVPFTLLNTWGPEKQALVFSPEFYGKNLSGNSGVDFDRELYDGGVGDSAYRFLDLVMQWKRRFPSAVSAMAKGGVKVNLLGSEMDALFGLDICEELREYLSEAGVNVELTKSRVLPHTPAFRYDLLQEDELSSFFEEALPVRRV